MAMKPNLVGPGGRLFAEPQPGKDEVSFRVDNTSEAYYNSPYYELHKNDLQQIPPPRKNVPMQLQLADFAGPAIISAIQQAGKITFHSVGDTGAAKVNREQTVQRAIENEAEVADAMANDVATGDTNGPAFFFHLGDVIYNFGEGQYYYDQFYEPFRAYDRPIFAIPGNHDGMVFGPGSSAPQVPTLEAFLNNFCAPTPGQSPDAGGLVRSVMTQPGVYFTLDAPYVSIIGLYSNVLDGPGVISSQGGKFSIVDDQLAFLKSELQRLTPDRNAGKSRGDYCRAPSAAICGRVACRIHERAGGLGLAFAKRLDFGPTRFCPVTRICTRDLHASRDRTKKKRHTSLRAAADLRQRLRKAQWAKRRSRWADDTLVVDPIVKFGYLTVTCDGKTLCVSFKSPAPNGGLATLDSVCVDLKAGKILPSGAAKKSGTKAKSVGKVAATYRVRHRQPSTKSGRPKG